MSLRESYNDIKCRCQIFYFSYSSKLLLMDGVSYATWPITGDIKQHCDGELKRMTACEHQLLITFYFFTWPLKGPFDNLSLCTAIIRTGKEPLSPLPLGLLEHKPVHTRALTRSIHFDPEAGGNIHPVKRPKNRINVDTNSHSNVPPSCRCLLSLGNDTQASVPGWWLSCYVPRTALFISYGHSSSVIWVTALEQVFR
jgi:hypothetical protein